ncbi:MAG TPA: UvrD-helicase domain-containing protein, partial [Candidatus Omnitrophota bacterium]|nr:UvrD-helicase domain-containing protein [Candidatus Omnitrophota bacterium]
MSDRVRAVQEFDQSLCVMAGAGSGKTTVLVNRFIHAVTERKIDPERVLAITFMEKAANEMKERLVREFEKRRLYVERRKLENAYVSTIHSFCAR